MDHYDWSWRRGRGYGPDYGRYRGFGGEPGWGGGGYGRSPWEGRGYDAGVYGPEHPGYGGYPGAPSGGMYYGGRGYGAEHGARGYDRHHRGPAPERYGAEYGQGAFLPESAYRRHPELDHRGHHGGDHWPDGPGGGMVYVELDDEEVRRGVERSLQQDDWVDAGRIQVEVRDRVVTLRGEVDDYLEARYAWDDAWEAMGVRGVVNQLTVQMDRPDPGGGEAAPEAGEKSAAPTSRRKSKKG